MNNQSTSPIEESSDVWASVIANVAPWMALVGDRNAKEFLRVSSSRDQLLLMATAPLGIFSILTAAIRLRGYRVLRRMIGRESERVSEALVELTPLSVAPASSVYTPHAVEIESSEQNDRVAYVCAHVTQTANTRTILEGFRYLISSRLTGAEHGDQEIVLGMKGNQLSADQTADLVISLVDERQRQTGIEGLSDFIASASISFRTTGVSPNQTMPTDIHKVEFTQVCNIIGAITLFLLMCGLHIGGYLYSAKSAVTAGSLQTLVMGLVGYCGIVIFTFTLLVIIKQEVAIEQLKLPDVFDRAVWTFSNAKHSAHRPFDIPPRRSLVQAAPKVFSPHQKAYRQVLTMFSCLGLVGSFITYYLGIRVANWWVALGSLAVIWLSAAFRSLVIKNFLVASQEKLEEHWLGAMQDNVYNSLLATVDTMARSTELPESPSEAGSEGLSLKAVNLCAEKPNAPPEKSHTLIVVKPMRQNLKTWSGCEDVMKVSLEMTKKCCQTHTFIHAGHKLTLAELPSLRRIIRIPLMIYVPGLLWKADTQLDYVLTEDFDFPNLYRDLIKIFQLCSDVQGQILRHETSDLVRDEVSHVLCGPVTDLPMDIQGTKTLAELLSSFRTAGSDTEKAYTLEQAVLLPTIQLAAMYETFGIDSRATPSIQVFQDGHTDRLKLSGAAYLPRLMGIFENQGIWQHFMIPKPTGTPPRLQPRNEKSGLYGRSVGKTYLFCGKL